MTSELADVRARLHARGERLTRPRQAIMRTLAEHPGHLSAEQILRVVTGEDPSVHRTTVYRNLEALISLGLVQHVHLSHGAAAYHLVPPEGEHLHVQCTTCSAITDVPAAVLDDVSEHLRRSYGFELDLGHVALSGTCTSCRAG